MRLRARFSIILIAFVFLLIGLTVATMQFVLVRRAVLQDEETTRALLRREARVLAYERDTLQGIASDWATGDDTYAFLRDHNPRFREINVTEDTFTQLRVDLIAIFDAAGTSLVACTSAATREDARVERVLGSVRDADALMKPGSAPRRIGGYLLLDSQLWLIALAPVLKSDYSGPVAGTVLMGRQISLREISTLAGQVGESIALSRLREMPPRRDPVTRLTGMRTITGLMAIPDAFGRGAVALEITLPRTAFVQSAVGLMYLAGWILACGGAVSLFAFGVLERWVLRDLTDSVQLLKSGLADIAAADQERPRLKIRRRDEMGDLAAAINAMVDALERSQDRRIQAEQESERRRNEATQAQKLASLGTLVAGVAHEVNNPNGIVDLNAHVLERLLARMFTEWRDAGFSAAALPNGGTLEAWEREVKESLGEIRHASVRIAGVVASLKRFALPSSGNRNESVDLNVAIRASCEWIRHEVAAKGCLLELDLARDLPTVKGNAQQLQQVVVNLLQNASKAAARPETGIRVQSLYTVADRTVRVRVQDEGCGIPAENLPRVLEPFFTTRREDGGTGLGLSISAEIVRAHGGRLSIESTVGVGTIVEVMLPAEGADHAG